MGYIMGKLDVANKEIERLKELLKVKQEEIDYVDLENAELEQHISFLVGDLNRYSNDEFTIH